MSWASRRETTRPEDMAYCLLGIFGVNMPTIYGEGGNAFLRLQEEIIKVSNDQTIFCWQAGKEGRGKVPSDWLSILAPHPSVFQDSGQFFPEQGFGGSAAGPYSITNYGLSISVPLLYTAMGVCAILDVGIRTGRKGQLPRVTVRLHRVPGMKEGHYVRLFPDLFVTPIPSRLVETRTRLFVDCRNARQKGAEGLISARIGSPDVRLTCCAGTILLLAFNMPVHIERMPGPGASLGMDFHPLESAVEMGHETHQNRSGIRLQATAGHEGSFETLVAGTRGPGGKIDWHIDVYRPDPSGSDDSIDSMSSRLTGLDSDAFGSWGSSAALRSLASWKNSDQGAVVCFLELDRVEVATSEENLADDGLAFQYLGMSTSSVASSMVSRVDTPASSVSGTTLGRVG